MENGSLENALKELILREELRPGERITEAALAKRLGVSRTPIRSLLPALAAQGFLQNVGKRGYAVADFGEEDSLEALDLRALLEGWAARRVSEIGMSAECLKKLEECLMDGDRLLNKEDFGPEQEHQYGVMNARFHRLIIEACNSAVITSFIDRLNHVPFVAPSVIVFDQLNMRGAFEMLHRAHGFHHAIVDAIKAGDGARAEFLFREHANHQRASMFERRKVRKQGVSVLGFA